MTDQDAYIAALPPPHKPIVQKLVTVLRAINAKYEIKRAWNGLGFKIGSNYSCLIADYATHVKLMIWRGTRLTDPENKLQGKGANTRHIKYYAYSDVEKDYLFYLLKQQKRLYDSGVPYEGG